MTRLPIFMRLYLIPLSFMLHLANREGKDYHFYKVKNKILKRYSTHIGYVVQFIEGKYCFTCNGTGIYKKYSHGFGVKGFKEEYCYNCDKGFYKKPCWNILERVKFGQYIFHRPLRRTYEKPDIMPHIYGYIDHKKHKYGWVAKSILFLLFEKGYLKRYYNNGYWWLKLSNKCQIIKSKFKKQDKCVRVQISDDDLPF